MMFAKIYPEIYGIVEKLKNYNHKKLPIQLQKIESFVFINSIAQELVKRGIVPLTIHDSVIVAENEVEEALTVIKTFFNKLFGVVPSFHVKPLRKNNGKRRRRRRTK